MITAASRSNHVYTAKVSEIRMVACRHALTHLLNQYSHPSVCGSAQLSDAWIKHETLLRREQ